MLSHLVEHAVYCSLAYFDCIHWFMFNEAATHANHTNFEERTQH